MNEYNSQDLYSYENYLLVSLVVVNLLHDIRRLRISVNSALEKPDSDTRAVRFIV